MKRLTVGGVVHGLLGGSHGVIELLLDGCIGCIESRLLVHPINRFMKTSIGRIIGCAR